MDPVADDFERSLLTEEQLVRVQSLVQRGVVEPVALNIVLRTRMQPTDSARALHKYAHDFVHFASRQLGSFTMHVITARHADFNVVTWRLDRQVWVGPCSARLTSFESKCPLLSPLAHWLRSNLAADTISLESYDLADGMAQALSRWYPCHLIALSGRREDIEVVQPSVPPFAVNELPRGLWRHTDNVMPPAGYLPRNEYLNIVVGHPRRVGPRTFRCFASSACGRLDFACTVDHSAPDIDSAYMDLRTLYVRDYGVEVPEFLYTRRRDQADSDMESIALCDVTT